MPQKKATDNPLAVDESTLKEFDIKEDVVSPIRKLTFLQGQYDELETMFWRSRIDVVHAHRLIESDVEALQQKGRNNIVEHKNQVNQFYGGMMMIRRLIDQLREKYPELQVEE